MTYLNRKIFLLFITFISLQINAQNGINSPYSRYGFGMLSDRAMGFNKAMGGVAMGFRDGQIINAANPASYSAVDSLTALFDLGMSLHNGNYKMGNLQSNAKNSSFDYAAFHFRATKGIGVALGILPYSNINYDFSSLEENIEGTENVTTTYNFNGEGGLHKVFLGAGFQIIKPLSLGFNVSYLYGSYTHKMSNTFSGSNVNSVDRAYTASINTYMFDFGAQYELKLNTKDKLTFGAAYSFGHDINDDAIRTTSSVNSNSAVQSQKSDTISNAFQLPHSFSVGVTYTHGYKWNVGVDFELEKWGDVKFPNHNGNNYLATKGLLNDRIKMSLGGSYTPAYQSSKYLNTVSYKFGGYFSKSYANADVTGSLKDKPTEFGLSAGVTLPISNRNLWHNIPKINISLQWVHSNIPYLSMTNSESKLTENYFRLCLGLTFSERWFYKWKVQ